MNEEIYEFKPKYNLLYELLMPTGKKVRKFIVAILLCIILYICINTFAYGLFTNEIVGSFDIADILSILFIILGVLSLIALIIQIIFYHFEYKNISYKFYEDHIEYEDKFLNQQLKNIKYKDIKEIEIRRSIWDRIMGYSVLIVYTNADNSRRNGLIIYSVRYIDKYYDKLNELIKKDKSEILDQKNQSLNNNIEK